MQVVKFIEKCDYITYKGKIVNYDMDRWKNWPNNYYGRYMKKYWRDHEVEDMHECNWYKSCREILEKG
jgi:hypothetical protein